jgi:hypothetical protein
MFIVYTQQDAILKKKEVSVKNRGQEEDEINLEKKECEVERGGKEY